MTAPTRSLPTHMHGRKRIFRQRRERIEARPELGPGQGRQPPLKRFYALRVVACIAAENDHVVAASIAYCPGVSPPFVTNAETLSNGREINPVREHERLRRQDARKRRPRFFDPGAMLIDERLYITGTGALRYDDLDAAPGEYLYGQAPRTVALSHRKARLGAGLVGVRK